MGIFRLVNHGVPVTLLSQLEDHAKRSPATGLKLDLEGDLPIVQSFFRVFQGDSDKIQIHTDGALARLKYED